MLGCGTEENGYAVYLCLDCGEKKTVCFSCKSGFCLSCAKAYVNKWVDYISDQLFVGTTYRHVVLTVPKELRIYFYRDKQLLGELMPVGHEMMQDALSHYFKEKVEVGSIMVAQTAGRNGEWNPHLHIIMTSGGLTKGKDQRWRELKYIPFELLHKKWQYHLFGLIKKHVGTEEACRHIDKLWKQYPNGLVTFLDKGEVPEGGKGLARYLAKYVVSPPIALGRITEYNGEEVSYWWQDHKSKKREDAKIGVVRFIGRMVQHILPKGFQRIRYYGLHGTCKADKVRALLGSVMNGGSEEVVGETYKVVEEKSYRWRIEEAFGVDPLVCRQCGTEMELLQIYHPKYGVIYDGRKELMRDEIRTGSEPGSGHAVRRASDDVSLQMPLVWT